MCPGESNSCTYTASTSPAEPSLQLLHIPYVYLEWSKKWNWSMAPWNFPQNRQQDTAPLPEHNDAHSALALSCHHTRHCQKGCFNKALTAQLSENDCIKLQIVCVSYQRSLSHHSMVMCDRGNATDASSHSFKLISSSS